MCVCERKLWSEVSQVKEGVGKGQGGCTCGETTGLFPLEV